MSIEFDSAKDYYAVLGLNDHATLDELKTARKTLVLQYHPDVSTSIDAATKFRAIQDAYEILSDAPTRAKYDAARNIILDKVAASVTSPPIGFITQQLNYGTVRKAASSTWQSLAADRLKSTAWQKLPLVSKKVFRSSNPKNGFLINLFAISSVIGIVVGNQVVLPRLNMWTESGQLRANH